jgi:type II restriction enzyme
MRLIDRLGKTEFTLAELYACQQQLEAIYPNNRNVLPKIRQQIQRLRDAEYLDFLGSGVYRLRHPPADQL